MGRSDFSTSPTCSRPWLPAKAAVPVLSHGHPEISALSTLGQTRSHSLARPVSSKSTQEAADKPPKLERTPSKPPMPRVGMRQVFLERNPTISHLDDETKTKYQTMVDS